MTARHDIDLSTLERQFGTAEGKVRFARFCNAAIMAESRGPLSTFPRLDDSPGQDGGFDGSWSLPDDELATNARPFALPGWNALQFKSIGSDSVAVDAFQRLKQSLRGAAQKLIARANRPAELRQYTLFTNLNLKRVEASSRLGGASLRSLRDELIAAVCDGLEASESVKVEIISAAELQAIVNQRPALRETFFGDNLFDIWDRAWAAMGLQPNTQPDVPLIGRAPQLEQLKTLLADPSIRFVGLTGASGMGKTRLGLEATRDRASQTYFVRLGAKSNFLVKDLSAYAGASRAIFVIEDLRPDEAKSLAQQAALHSGICVLASISAEEHLPRFGLMESRAIRSLRLPPLGPNESRELLKAAGAKLDSDAFDWVLQEAGGNPQILLVAAALGANLRLQAGQLRRNVAQNFLRKAKTLLGDGVEVVLELLSVLSPFDSRNDAHIKSVSSVFSLSADASTIRYFRDPLIDAALVESSGRDGGDLNVSPPLLAAYLVERALAGTPDRLLALYHKLDDDGRERLFDRLVSIDGSAGRGLWEHVFGVSGLFVGEEGLDENHKSLQILARAAPRQTAEFLRSRISDVISLLRRKKKLVSDSLVSMLEDNKGHYKYNQRIQKFSWGIYSVFRELLVHPDSSDLALSSVEQLATIELDTEFPKLFTECFILWIYDFPVSPRQRWSIIERLTRSSCQSSRKLGYEALFTITDSPRSKSGQIVQRRRLGERSFNLTYNELWDHHEIAFRRHLETATQPGPFRSVATKRLPGALGDLQRLPPVRVMPLLRSVARAFWRKEIELPPIRFLGLLIDTRDRFHEIGEHYPAGERATQLSAFSQELGLMIKRVEHASFAVRLAIWIGRQPSFGWERVDGTKRHRYEIELERLASEVAVSPRKLTAKLMLQLVEGAPLHSSTFAREIGRADRKKSFWTKFAALQNQPVGAWVFGSYCEGIAEHDTHYVECELEKAMPKADANMLPVLKRLGPTSANRRRLMDIVTSKKVTSSELARMFMTGSWLDNVPTREAKALLSYIARDASPQVTYELLQVFNLYVHPEKKIPPSVIPIAEAVLLRPSAHHHDTAYDADNLAEAIFNSNPSRGFRLFRSLLRNAASANSKKRCWNPVSGIGGSMDFFHRVRAANPTAIYKLLFKYLRASGRINVLDHEATPFDLADHPAALLRLTKGDVSYAITVTQFLRVNQAGFWPFIFALLAQHPSNEKLRDALASIFLDEWRWRDADVLPPSFQVIEQQLSQPSLPTHGRIFLEEVRAELSKHFAPRDSMP